MPASARWWWAVPHLSPVELPALTDPAAPSDAADLEALLLPARSALERGDYGRCQQLLAPLLEAHGASTSFGGQLRLLLATAQMGRGDSAGAAATCRSLRACRDATLRAMAKDLQEVLDAPALERPREWSMTLPSLGEMQPLEGQLQTMARQRRRRRLPEPPPPPPTGPTQAPWGFALVAIALLALTVLLGGCVDLETRLSFPAPGRLQLSQISRSSTGEPLPWQRQLAASLQGTPFRAQQAHGLLSLKAPTLPADQALQLLTATIEQAAALAAVPLPPPELSLQERNWLVGVHQELRLAVDLRALESLPGLTLMVELEPFRPRAVRLAAPQPALAQQGRLRWRLQPGTLNRLELRCWRWSRLGLGALLIVLLLAGVAVLQRLRLLAGFGLPELPA